MPKLPVAPKKPPYRGKKRKTSETEQRMLQAIFDRKIVSTRYSPRYAHILAGEKTLCGLPESQTNPIKTDWAQSTHCLRCEATMTRIERRLEREREDV